MTSANTETRLCRRCQGTGQLAILSARPKACSLCDGAGSLPAPDPAAIEAAVIKNGRLRRSAPRHGTDAGLAGRRAYLVWRWLAFDTGIDMSWPVMAEALLAGDPFHVELMEIERQLLNQYSDGVSKGAHRWAPLLGLAPATPFGIDELLA